MSAIILNGKELAAQMETAQAQRVRDLQARGVSPKLVVVMAGDNPASAIYVRNKARACERLGILSDTIHLPQTVSQQELLLFCAGAVVVLSVVSGLFNFASRTGMAKGTELFCRDLRNKVYRHVQYLPFKWHVNNQTGEIIQRCTSDLDVVRGFASQQLLQVVRTVLLVVVAL